MVLPLLSKLSIIGCLYRSKFYIAKSLESFYPLCILTQLRAAKMFNLTAIVQRA